MKAVQQRERGQSLVLVALGAIVLVAFVGLAVDGGNAFAQRRISQNAADGASLYASYVMAGNTWRQYTPDPIQRRDMLLREINKAVEAHAVPDTNNLPGDAINGNVHAYYRDDKGKPISTCAGDCEVATTLTIPENAWGVEVFVNLPFTTYFTGIIGWNQMTVSARAIGVVHAGQRGAANERWALFALDRKTCDGDQGYEIDILGTGNNLNGNVHSNHSFRMDVLPNSKQIAVYAETSYVPTGTPQGTCVNCVRPKSTDRIGIVVPEFDNYYNLARTQGAVLQDEGGSPNYIFPRPSTPNSRDLGQTGAVPGVPPYTFINGNLVITSTSTAFVQLSGLIVVNGNVDIQAPRVRQRGLGYSLLATGTIRVAATNTALTGSAFEMNGWDPLVAVDGNDAILWSNQDLDAAGGNACTTPVIEFNGRGTNILGAIMAPTGRVNFLSSDTNKIINGTVIADTIYARGKNHEFKYNARYFPPQPDLIELME